MSPTLERELALVTAGRGMVIAVDEVGRGAIAGPVTVGAGIWLPTRREVPEGIRDSKLVSETKRPALATRAREWLDLIAVGQATASEVDSHGITVALGLAGARAIEELATVWGSLDEAVVLLDGHHDWLTAHLSLSLPVVCQVKGDRDCASISAVSLVAKVERDGEMVAAHEQFPVYGFDRHKGYGSAGHFEAIAQHGPCELHRLTWLRPTELPLDGD